MSLRRVLRHAGSRTLRFAFNDPTRAEEAHQELHGRVIASGLPHEWHGAGYLAVLLRNVRRPGAGFGILG